MRMYVNEKPPDSGAGTRPLVGLSSMWFTIGPSPSVGSHLWQQSNFHLLVKWGKIHFTHLGVIVESLEILTHDQDVCPGGPLAPSFSSTSFCISLGSRTSALTI